MKYYLKTVKTYFYDPHGDADYGGVVKMCVTEEETNGVTLDGEYITLDDMGSYMYKKGINQEQELLDIECETCSNCQLKRQCELAETRKFFPIPDDYDDVMEFCGEDGYNCEVNTYLFREISEDEFYRYNEIINEYNKL